jgi:K+-sensing histidine kinase KdpD
MSDSTPNNYKTIGQKLIDGLDFELRTLLNGFVGPMQYLKYKIDDHSMIDIFRMLDSSLSRLERLSSRAAIVKSIENNFSTLDKQKVNLVDIVRFNILELQPIADLENIKIKISADQEEIFILGDYNFLLHAFQILLEQAISLSTAESSIYINFTSHNNETQCVISTNIYNFLSEIINQPNEESNRADLSWDISLARTILFQHNAILKTNCNELRNDSICITFKG